MPWHIVSNSSSCPSSKPYAVVQNSNGKTVGCHPTKAKAQAQLAALNINVKGSEPMTELVRDNLFRAIYPGVEVRESQDGPPILAGHFARFDEWTEIESVFEGRFMEQISPGAFSDSFARQTPKALFQHGRDPDIGDKVLGSPVTVREDAQGAAYEVPLFPSVPALVVDGLRAGAYGASFRFSVDNDEVIRKPQHSDHNPEGLPERTITKASVAEFGPVTFPAYAGATAGIRSITDEFRPQDFNAQLDLMVREHPQELARRLADALKGSEAEPPEPKPQPTRFRDREEFLEWITKS